MNLADRFGKAILISIAVLASLALAYTVAAGAATGLFRLWLPLLTAIGGIAALALPRDVRLTTALTLVGLGVGVYGAEIWLRATAPTAESAVVPGGDSRSKYQVVQDLRQSGQVAYPSVFPAYLLQTGMDGRLHSPLMIEGMETLPLGGVGDVETVLCNEAGPWVSYRADEMGFANPPGLWTGSQAEIAIIGDSFAQGYCVATGKTFADRIRAQRPQTVNVAASGSGPLVELAVLRELLPRLRPRTVLWFFYEGNDYPGNLAIEQKSPLLMRYLEDAGFSQDLWGRRDRVDAALRGHIDGLLAADPTMRETNAGRIQQVVSFLTLSTLRSRFGGEQHPPVDPALLRRVLAAAHDSVSGWGGRLVLVALPAWSSVATDDASLRGRLQPVQELLATISGDLGIPVIDIRKTFATHPDPAALFPFRLPNHYNQEGHALVAETVNRWLDDNPVGVGGRR